MKKTTFLLAGLFGAGFSFGQIFSDNFDAVPINTYIGPTSTYWSTWSGTEGGNEDAKTTNNQANSQPNSVYFSSTAASGGPQDVLLKFGQLYTNGIFTLETDFYINSGKNAYFNIQGALNPGTTWALNVNMDGGQIYIDDATTPNLAVGSYTEGAWFKLKIEANLTLKVWKAYVNNNLFGTWINGVNSVASVDYFPIQNSQFYIDNVSFDHQPYTLSNLNGMVAMLDMGGELAGQIVYPKIRIVNAGLTTINSCDINLNYNGTNYTQNLTGLNLASTANQSINVGNVNLASGNLPVVATISNVNGQNDDVSSDDTLSISLNPIVPAAGKMVVSEEGTGTWCQYCPRGAVFMDQFNSKYSQFWVGIAVHNGDPMTVTDYDSAFGNLISGYPSALVDRGADVDPSGMSPDFFERIQIAPVATIQNGATWDPSTRVLQVSVSADFVQAANSNYKLLCVLTEDGVTGTGSGYNQVNAYANNALGPMGGYESLANPVPAAQMVYDHVARAIAPSFTGYANSFPATVSPGATHTLNFDFTLPASWDENSIHIVGMLVDPQGRIDNAGKATIAEAVSNGYVLGSNAGIYDFSDSELAESLNIYPNPANSFANISFNSPKSSEVELKVSDLSGKILAVKNYGIMNGAYDITLNTSNYSSGIYIVEMSFDGRKVQKRLIIE
jgi:hypothetical protein